MNMMRLIGAGALALSLSAAAEDLTIAAGESVLLDADKEVGTLTVGEGATLWLNGHTLTVTTALAGSGTVNASTGPAVPDDYVKVEYVEADGNQWIDTGVNPTPPVKVEADAMFTGNLGKQVWSPLIAASYSNNNNKFGVWVWLKTVSGYGYNRLATLSNDGDDAYFPSQANKGIASDTRYNIVSSWTSSSYTISVNGESKTASRTFNSALSANMYVPARYNGVSVVEKGLFKIYGLKIYKPQDTPVRNYVPVKRKSDEVAGFYDTVSGNFYASISGTDFLHGEEKPAPQRWS